MGRLEEDEIDGLFRKVGSGDLRFVSLAILSGVDVNIVNRLDYTMLMSSVANAQVKMAQFLIKSGANVNAVSQGGRSVMHTAVGAAYLPDDRLRCVRLLVDSGSQIDPLTESGETPLMSAAWFGLTSCVIYLLESGADPERRELEKGRSAMDLAIEKGHKDIPKIILRSL